MLWKTCHIAIASMFFFSASALAADSQDQTPIVSGKDEYVWNCAECHGQDGRGNGPLAEALIKKPADLTQIAKNNLGVFPEEKIFKMIAGAEDVVGHQSLQMPRFWERFQHSESKRGYEPSDIRIKAIVDHLKELQAH